MINVTKNIERLTPTSSMGYGVKVTFVFTSFDENKIDAVEKQMNNIDWNCTEKEEVKGDMISRQAVIYYIKPYIQEIITESGVDKNKRTNRILRAIINGIETMPTGKEEPAEWIVDTDDSRRWDRVRYYCSACNGWNTYGKSKYCPNCGHLMKKEESSL